ncbi:MAG: TlpA disulfide reductase family protein [Bacteroidota bacterium]|jgi:peroxiredoxin
MKHSIIAAFFLLIMWTAFSQGQKVNISGVAPGAGGKFIVLSTVSDYLTNTEITLAKAPVDSSGNFQMSITTDKTIVGKMSIDFHSAGFYISPGKTYDINILPYKYDEVKELNPFINSANLQMELKNLPQDDLNYVLGEFDRIYNAFLVEHFNGLYREHNRVLLDTLRANVTFTIGAPTDQYALNYMDYKIANVVQLVQLMGPEMIGYNYFTTRPVLYDNMMYMDFFNTYFNKYMFATSRILKKNDYHSLLAAQDPYAALLKALATDTLLKPARLRELVLIKGLMDMYNTSGEDKKNIIAVIKTIEEKSPAAEARLIAGNVIKNLTHLQPGTPAPLFQLRNRSNTATIKLDSLRGKVVVLNFWTSYCAGCTDEMDNLRPLTEKFKDKVVFVSVSSEYSRLRMRLYLDLKKDWDWVFLHIGDQTDVLKEYDVRSLPLYVIIDKDGNIYKYAAELPSSGLENTIEQLLQSSK